MNTHNSSRLALLRFEVVFMELFCFLAPAALPGGERGGVGGKHPSRWAAWVVSRGGQCGMGALPPW